MEELQQDLGCDIYSGIGDSVRALEFRSQFSREQNSIALELVRLQRERQQIERSLETLKKIDT